MMADVRGTDLTDLKEKGQENKGRNETAQPAIDRDDRGKREVQWEQYLMTRTPIIAPDGYIPNSVVRAVFGYISPGRHSSVTNKLSSAVNQHSSVIRQHVSAISQQSSATSQHVSALTWEPKATAPSIMLEGPRENDGDLFLSSKSTQTSRAGKEKTTPSLQQHESKKQQAPRTNSSNSRKRSASRKQNRARTNSTGGKTSQRRQLATDRSNRADTNITPLRGVTRSDGRMARLSDSELGHGDDMGCYDTDSAPSPISTPSVQVRHNDDDDLVEVNFSSTTPDPTTALSQQFLFERPHCCDTDTQDVSDNRGDNDYDEENHPVLLAMCPSSDLPARRASPQPWRDQPMDADDRDNPAVSLGLQQRSPAHRNEADLVKSKVGTRMSLTADLDTSTHTTQADAEDRSTTRQSRTTSGQSHTSTHGPQTWHVWQTSDQQERGTSDPQERNTGMIEMSEQEMATYDMATRDMATCDMATRDTHKITTAPADDTDTADTEDAEDNKQADLDSEEEICRSRLTTPFTPSTNRELPGTREFGLHSVLVQKKTDVRAREVVGELPVLSRSDRHAQCKVPTEVIYRLSPTHGPSNTFPSTQGLRADLLTGHTRQLWSSAFRAEQPAPVNGIPQAFEPLGTPQGFWTNEYPVSMMGALHWKLPALTPSGDRDLTSGGVACPVDLRVHHLQSVAPGRVRHVHQCEHARLCQKKMHHYTSISRHIANKRIVEELADLEKPLSLSQARANWYRQLKDLH